MPWLVAGCFCEVRFGLLLEVGYGVGDKAIGRCKVCEYRDWDL